MSAWRAGLLLLFAGLLSMPAADARLLGDREAVGRRVLGALVDAARRELKVHRGEHSRERWKRPPSDSPLAARNTVRVVFLLEGQPVGSGSGSGASLPANARAAAARALADTELADDAALTVLVEVLLPDLPGPGNLLRLSQKLDVGREGFVLRHEERDVRVTGAQILLSGRAASHHVREALKTLGLGPMDLAEAELEWQAFGCVLGLGLPGGEVRGLYRWGSLVRLRDVDRGAVERALGRAASWYNARDVGAQSCYVQAYNPVLDALSEGRPRLAATLGCLGALGRLADVRDDPALRRRGRQALSGVLAKHFVAHPDEAWGYVEDGDAISLETSALALSAIARLSAWEAHGEKAGRLAVFLRKMQQPDGSYRTWLRPAGRNARQNSAPGEAQRALLSWYRRNPDEDLLAAIRRGHAFYRAYWRRERALRFVPAQSRANARLYRITRERAVADFVIEMNDLVLSTQQRGAAIPADRTGRFRDPMQHKRSRPFVGQSGAHLDSLLIALELARELGDDAAEVRLRVAAVQALRHVLQLQVKEADAWCMPSPERAIGAFRDSVDEPYILPGTQWRCAEALTRALEVLEPTDYTRTHLEAEAAGTE
jgi:hypothetical protein